LPLVAPDVKLSAVGAVLSVKPGVTTVAATVADAFAAIEAPVVVPDAAMLEVSTPALPELALTVKVLVFVPPAGSMTREGERLQEPVADPLAEQVRATVPAKPLTEARVMVLVPLPAAGMVTIEGEGVSVKDDAVRVTTTAGALVVTPPPTPVITMLSVPDVPGIVTMLSVLDEDPALDRVTVEGESAQDPAAVPPLLVTMQLRATEPAKAFVEVRVIASVFPVVAPEMSV